MKNLTLSLLILLACTGCKLMVGNGLLVYENENFGGLDYDRTSVVRETKDSTSRDTSTSFGTGSKNGGHSTE